MDPINPAARIYPVTPGRRYAVTYYSTDGSAISIYWRDTSTAKESLFVLPDGSTASLTLSAGAGGGFEFVAPTDAIRVTTTGSIDFGLVLIQE